MANNSSKTVLNDGSTIDLSLAGTDHEQRQVWRSVIQDSNGKTLLDDAELRTGCYAKENPATMLQTFCDFLTAWLEALGYGEHSENFDLFPANLADWAQANQTGIEYLAYLDPETSPETV